MRETDGEFHKRWTAAVGTLGYDKAAWLAEEARRMRETPSREKPDLEGWFRDNPETPEGKYHVQRRDGTTVEWPSFVLGARDPMVPWTLRFYSVLGLLMGQLKWKFVVSTWRWGNRFSEYRRRFGKGDPGKGRHRRDDPETLAKMRNGMSG